MGFAIEKNVCIFLFGLIVLFPAFCSASKFTPSRASFYGSPEGYGTASGACGYEKFGSTLNGGVVSAVSSRLYRNGVGCGACYQVRCKNPQLCNYKGVQIVVTDYGEGDRTDFILSARAYSKMALNVNATKKLLAYGVVDVEYKRVPCKYSGFNLMYKVHENSRNPDYLALVLIYVGGQNDITSVELWQEKFKKWVPMRRVYGAVWDMPNPPEGPITLRFQVTDNTGNTYWWKSIKAIPKNWKAGAVYDSKIQLPLKY